MIAGAIIVNVVNKQQYGPQAVAQSYADAVNSGDMEKANKIAKVRIPKGAREDLLDPRFINASPDKLSDLKVGDTERSGNTARITMSYTVQGQEHSMQLHAEKKGKKGLFFDNWELQGPQVQPVTIDLPVSEMKVNDENFTTDVGSGVFALYPGTYNIEVPESKYLKGASKSITLGFADDPQKEPESVSLYVSPKEAFQKEVQSLVNKEIKKCVKSHDAAPKGCPFSIDTNSQSQGIKFKDDVKSGSIRWKLEKKPVVGATYSTATGGGVYFTKTSGEVSFTADSKKAGKKAWKSAKNLKFKVSGSVEIVGDRLKIKSF